jgi:ketosteroid isomerase-like protein
MQIGATTPEELETLLEDAFVNRDRGSVTELFENDAVLVADGAVEARGHHQIAQAATALWQRDGVYTANPRQVLQARNTALVIAERGISVSRRGADGAWRYAITLLEIESKSRGANDD